MEKIELGYCPFCGESSVGLFEKESGFIPEDFEYFSRCNRCRARTASYDNQEDAVKMWNVRTSEPRRR